MLPHELVMGFIAFLMLILLLFVTVAPVMWAVFEDVDTRTSNALDVPVSSHNFVTREELEERNFPWLAIAFPGFVLVSIVGFLIRIKLKERERQQFGGYNETKNNPFVRG
jgi:ABC-type transport system involved in cytochrome c biogenesis permease subunit